MKTTSTMVDDVDSNGCTGIAASWCPVHGDCTCPREEDGSPVERVEPNPRCVTVQQYLSGASLVRIEVVHDPKCPLHGDGSLHATGVST